MRTRRSWRNQNRVWKMLGRGNWEQANAPQAAKPKPEPVQRTVEEIDAMWWLSKRTRAMLKRDL